MKFSSLCSHQSLNSLTRRSCRPANFLIPTPSGFTLVELVVVLGIALVLMGFWIQAFSKAVSDRKFQNNVESFYSVVYDQLLQTVLVQNRSLVLIVDTTMSGAYATYTESDLERPIAELRPYTGSYSSPSVNFWLAIRNNTIASFSGGQVFRQNSFEKAASTATWNSSTWIVVPSSPTFLSINEKSVPGTELYLADADGNIKTGKLTFSYFGGGESYGKALVNRIEGTDFRNAVVLLDTLEIRYTPKWKKVFHWFKSGISQEYKKVRIVFTSPGASSLYIDLE